MLFFILRSFYLAYWKQVKARAIFLLFAALFGGVTFFFIVLTVETQYLNVLSALPLAILIYYVIYIGGNRVIRYGTITAMVFLSLLSLYPFLLFPFFLKDGIHIAEARAKFASLIPAYPTQKFYMTLFQNWALSEEYERMNFLGDVAGYGMDPHPDLSNSIVIASQNDVQQLTPPEKIESCSLRVNYFAPKAPTLFHIKLAPAVPGYGFAIYECD